VPRVCGAGRRHRSSLPGLCEASGRALREDKVTIRIPPGIPDGATLRLAGRGMPSPVPGGPPGAVQLLAAAGAWAGNQLARWSAVAVAGLSATGQMFLIPACPPWSLVIIAADAAALWGLCAHGNRENPGAA
jgi:hypothetical protein